MIPPELLPDFVRLVSALSPENLTCDGELKGWQVRVKEKQLHLQWKRLEHRLGRAVSEDEVWAEYLRTRGGA